MPNIGVWEILESNMDDDLFITWMQEIERDNLIGVMSRELSDQNYLANKFVLDIVDVYNINTVDVHTLCRY